MAAQPNEKLSTRLLGLSVGVAAIAAGGALTLKPFNSLDALTLFIAGSLVLAGLGEILTARDHSRTVDRIAGALFIVTGLAALALRDQTIRAVAVVAGAGLLISGASRVVAALRGRTDERYVDGVGGLAGMAFGVLALAWRDATILVVAALVGPVAVIFGAAQVLRALRGRPRPVSASATQPGRRRAAVHRTIRVLRASGALIIALALIGVSNQFHRGAPSVGAFYSAPDDLPDTPGQLLRSEAFDRALPNDARAERILFTTTALDGSIGVASALVVIPTAEPTGPWPVLLWEHGTTGVAEKCAPSILADPLGSGAMPARQQAIDNGWVIVAPDYIGLGTRGPHPYLIGIPTAQSSLDAVRAARHLDDLSLSDQTVVWGHSQGGGAALWVGIEAKTYAPDVPLLGVAAMAPASDLPSLASVIEHEAIGMLFGSFILDAYSRVYPDVRFGDYVRASARAVLEAVVERCLSEPAAVLSLGAIASGENVYSRPPTDGPLAVRLAENVPDTPSGIPTFLGQGAADPLIRPDAQAAFVAELCAAGQVVEYYTYAGRDHLSVVADDSPMMPDLIDWTQGRFAGQPPASSCTTTTR